MLRVLLCSLVLVLAACSPKAEAPVFNSVDVTGADWGRDFSLVAADGKPRRLGDYKGKVVAMFFGYTHCPDVCPTTMSRLREAMKQLGDDANRVQVLFVTLDPERDTPELLAQYVPAFDPSFVGLTGTPEAIAATAKDFKVFYRRQPGSSPERYTIDHSAGIFVFDPQGRLRLFMRDGEEAAKMAADIRVLLANKSVVARP